MKKDYSATSRPGDEGKTVLYDGACNKNSPRVEAYGTVDELNSFIGLARARAELDGLPELATSLALVQEDLFVLGAELATRSQGNQSPGKGNEVSSQQVKRLEKEIAAWAGELAPVNKFVLPGGTALAALLHVCRATCRRAERRILDLHEREPVGKPAYAYVNRLSDWLYQASRVANQRAGKPESLWTP